MWGLVTSDHSWCVPVQGDSSCSWSAVSILLAEQLTDWLSDSLPMRGGAQCSNTTQIDWEPSLTPHRTRQCLPGDWGSVQCSTDCNICDPLSFTTSVSAYNTTMSIVYCTSLHNWLLTSPDCNVTSVRTQRHSDTVFTGLFDAVCITFHCLRISTLTLKSVM